jgi:hypothetical protein
MERLQQAAVLLALVEKLRDRGDWCGETHIQKTTYFLQQLMNVPLDFDFILYKHGPFSFDLRDEINAMLTDNILALESRPYPYGPSILPGKGSETLKDCFSKTFSMYKKQLEFITEKLSGKTVTELERLATALFVTFEQEATSLSRAKRINELKPHIPVEQALEAIEVVDSIVDEARDFH